MVSPSAQHAHIEFTPDERRLISLPVGKTDFTKQELEGFLATMRLASDTTKFAPLHRKISKAIDTLWEKTTNRLKPYDPSLQLDKDQLQWLYATKQRVLHSLRERRANKLKEITEIVSEEKSDTEQDLHTTIGHLLNEYDTRIQSGVEELVLLEKKLHSAKSYVHLDEIGKRLAASDTFEQFAYAYQDLQIATRAIGKEDSGAAEIVSQLKQVILSKTATLLDKERQRVRAELDDWRRKTTFNFTETKDLIFEIAKLQKLSEFALDSISHATEGKSAIEQSVAAIKKMKTDFEDEFAKKLAKTVPSKEDKSQGTKQETAIHFGSGMAGHVEGKTVHIVLDQANKDAIQAAAARLVSFECISKIADLSAVSKSVQSAMKASWVSSPYVQNATLIAGQLAIKYYLSPTYTDFAIQVGTYAVTAATAQMLRSRLGTYATPVIELVNVAVPYGVNWAAKQVMILDFSSAPPAQTTSEQPVLMQNAAANVTVTPPQMVQGAQTVQAAPITQAAPPISSEMPAATASPSAEMPPAALFIAPPTPPAAVQEEVQVQTDAAPPPTVPQAAAPVVTAPTPPPVAPPAVEVAPEAAAPAAVTAPPATGSWVLNTAWKAAKAFSDFSIKYSPYNLAPDFLKPFVQTASMQTLAPGSIGTIGQTGSTK